MAQNKLGRNAFTVQESVNMNTFTEWYYEELDLNDEATSTTDATCDTDHTAGSGSSFGDNPKIIKMDSTSALSVGLAVSGTGIATGSYITQIDSGTLFRVSEDTTATNDDQTLTFKGGVDSEDSTYITSARPAKKIVLYEVPGGAKPIEDIDSLTITINGKTDTEKKLIIDVGDLPFTISGTLMTSLSIAVDNANLDNALSVISFH